MKIENAVPAESRQIARLIMEAMNYECCLNLMGKGHTLGEFEDVMTRLVAQPDSQYSYRNTLVARSEGGALAGICVSYNGADLHRLRHAFEQAAMQHFKQDYRHMDDEAQPDELYIDSLAVNAGYRHQGIATALLNATADKARALGIARVGLLVDKGNPEAERLYRHAGFQYANDTAWGGHAMRHLVKMV